MKSSVCSQAIALTLTSGTTKTFAEYKSACSFLLTEVTASSISVKILTMSLEITIIKITLTTTEITEITTIKGSIETQILIIEQDIIRLLASLKEATGTVATDVQISTGAVDGKTSDVAEESIKTLQIVVKHTTILINVKTVLEAAIAGTLTTGTETTSAAFVTLVESFITVISNDNLDITIFTLAMSITTAKVTLTTSDITIIKTQLTIVETTVAILEALTVQLQTKVKSITGSEASNIQILSGSASGNLEMASEVILLEMKALTISLQVSF